jgi:WD40 repeat protein
MSKQSVQNRQVNIFISYSRQDVASADALVAALETQDFAVTIDRRNLPYGEEWQKEIANLIRGSDTVVWLVSAASAASKWCNWELGELGRLNKRLIPIKIREIAPDSLPEAIGKIQLLPAEGVFSLDAHLTALVDTLNTDRAWIKESTRLGDLAREWTEDEQRNDQLLRGNALREAEHWAARHPRSAPLPSSEILDFILASRRGATRRQRWTIGVSLGIALGAMALAAEALRERSIATEREQEARIQKQEADRQRDQANQQRSLADEQRDIARRNESIANEQRELASRNEKIANEQRELASRNEKIANEQRAEAETQRDQALLNQSRTLVTGARQRREIGDVTAGLLMTMAALPDQVAKRSRPYLADAEAELNSAINALGEFKVFRGTSYRISPTAIGPDGAKIVVGVPGTTAEIRDIASGRRLAVLEGHSLWVRSANFSPDGKSIVTASQDKTAIIWDASSGKPDIHLRGHTETVAQAVFSADGNAVLTFSNHQADATARIFDARTGAQRAVLRGHGKWLMGAVFSPDGKQVLTAAADETARIWNVDDGKEVARLEGHKVNVQSAEFSPDGSTLLTASSDGTAAIWKRADPRNPIVLKDVDPKGLALGSSNHVYRATFSPDGKLIATASTDGVARIWDVSGRLIRLLKGHQSWVEDVSFSPDGKLLVSASKDQTARIWDLATGDLVTTLRGHRRELVSATFSKDKQWILTSANDQTFRMWRWTSDAKGYRESDNDVLVIRNQRPVLAASFSSDGKVILTRDNGPNARLWDAASGRGIRMLEGATLVSPNLLRPSLRGSTKVEADAAIHASPELLARLNNLYGLRNVAGVRVTTSGIKALTGPRDFSYSELGILDMSTGQEVKLPLKTSGPPVVDLNANATRLVSFSVTDTVARLWNLDTGTVVAELKDHPIPLADAVFSPDGSLVATVSMDLAKVWSASDGRLLVQVKTPVRSMKTVVFSPDNSLLVSVEPYGDPSRVWDVASGRELAVLAGHATEVMGATFNAKGDRLITTSRDKTARVWNVKSGEPVAVLEGHDRTVTSAAFSPDGSLVVTGSEDGTARIWRVAASAAALVERGKRAAPRCFDREELQAAGLGPAPPAWCVTGAGLENEPNSSKWEPKWPYHAPQWKHWLEDVQAGKNRSLPTP